MFHCFLLITPDETVDAHADRNFHFSLYVKVLIHIILLNFNTLSLQSFIFGI